MIDAPRLDVSRETQEKIDLLEALVLKWTPKINLIAKSTLPDFQSRHILDGILVFRVADQNGSWVDMGTGGGFPGLVVAILAGEKFPVTMIESDARKCAFLRTACRELDLTCRIIHDRIENIEPLNADVISARALAPLSKLLSFSARHSGPSSTLLFPKGRQWRDDEVQARAEWSYDLDIIESPASPGSVVLKIKNLSRAAA